MAHLYASPLRGSGEPSLEDDLPGLSALPPGQLVNLGLDQVDAALKVLGPYLEPSGLTLPATAALRRLLGGKDHAALEDLRRAILDLHVELLTTLTAGDFRRGKAVRLGPCCSRHLLVVTVLTGSWPPSR